MAGMDARRPGLGSLVSAMVCAMQWRLLLLWLLIMLVPATVAVLPLWRVLAGLLDHSVHASSWAQHFSAMMFGDVGVTLSENVGWLGGSAILGLAMTLAMAPFLDGMIIGSGRAGRPLGFAALLQNGWIEYGRMFRLTLWSLLPYLAVIGIALLGSHFATQRAERAVLESQADLGSSVAHWALLVAFVLAQCMVESARAAFIADTSLRSATRAFGRGINQILRRFFRTLFFYLIVSAIGLAMAGIAGVGRIHVTAAGTGGFLIALLLSQLIVLAFGWMRVARLFALAEVASSLQPGRRRPVAFN
jgi:hypothetical protein